MIFGVLPKPLARTFTTQVMDAYFSTPLSCVRRSLFTLRPCSNLSAWPNRAPTSARLFLFRKGTGTPTIAAALIAHGFVAIPLVTTGVTSADVTSSSHADDGAADQGMDCT